MPPTDLDFSDFASAAVSDELACPLTQELDALLTQTKASFRQAARCAADIETSLPHSSDILQAIDKWRSGAIESLLRTVVKQLKEGHTLELDEHFVLEVLHGPNYFDTLSRGYIEPESVLEVWDSRKLVAARNQKFGNLEEAEKRQLCRKIAARLQRRPPTKDVEKQIVFYLYLFRDERYEKGVYQPSWNSDRLETFLDFQRLTGTIASKRPLADCTPFIPEILSNRGPFSSADLFRWHPLEANGISRFRLYKEGQVAFELETDTLKQELLHAINIYTADLQREA